MLRYETVKRRFPEVRVIHGKNGPEFNVNCPRPHKKGGIYKLDINVSNGAFVCHDCGFAGSAYDEWFKQDELEGQFAHLAIRRDEGGIDPAVMEQLNRRPVARSGDEIMENGIPAPGKLVPMHDLPETHLAWQYLVEDRGLNREELCGLDKSSMLYYCTEGHPTRGGGTNAGRIVFPLYSANKLCGWQARQIERITAPNRGEIHRRKMVWQGDRWHFFEWVPSKNKFRDQILGIPKYNTCHGMVKSQCFYNFQVASRESDSVVVVEGPMDVLAVGRSAIAAMGALSRAQKRLITSCWDTAFIIRDPDIDPNSEKFKNMLNDLSSIKIHHLGLPDGKDAGATSRAVIWKCIDEAQKKPKETK